VDLLRVRANRGRFGHLAYDVANLLSRLSSEAESYRRDTALMSIGMLAAVHLCSMEPADALIIIYEAAKRAGLTPSLSRLEVAQ